MALLDFCNVLMTTSMFMCRILWMNFRECFQMSFLNHSASEPGLELWPMMQRVDTLPCVFKVWKMLKRLGSPTVPSRSVLPKDIKRASWRVRTQLRWQGLCTASQSTTSSMNLTLSSMGIPVCRREFLIELLQALLSRLSSSA